MDASFQIWDDGFVDLNALQDFVLVATHGGFAAASRARGIPKSSLSRRVRELEEDLGIRLFERTSRAFRLTDEGAQLYQGTGPTLAGVEEVEQQLRSRSEGEPTGRLRIAAPALFGHLFLGRLAARYHAAYPKVELEIVVGDRLFDPLTEGFDAAIRVNTPDSNDLVARRFATRRMQLVCAPSFAASFGEVTAAKCRALPMVLYDNPPSDPPWRFSDGRRRLTVVPRPALRLSALPMVRDAILEGAGFAMLPDTVSGADVVEGRLLRLGDLEGVEVALTLVHPSRRLVSRRLRAFIDLLVAAFADG
jgi:DNA-binding transcriptional LysR family regulator